ncbi:hypothetical protein FRC08_014536 [Ceratobasidium sp. 394]|nr:hypothetical protein FRC08_014536 [Ceratobasidium sp. 394]
MCWLPSLAHRLSWSTHSVINAARRHIGLGPLLEHPPVLKTPLLDPPTKTFEKPAIPIAYRYSFLKRPCSVAFAQLRRVRQVWHPCPSFSACRTGVRASRGGTSAGHAHQSTNQLSPDYPLSDSDPINRTPRLSSDATDNHDACAPLARRHSGHIDYGTPASASTISQVSPIRARFGFPMTHALPTAAFGEGAGLARDPEMEVEEDIEDADVRTEVRSPELGEELRLPPIRTLPPMQPYGESVVKQTRRAMRAGGAVSRDVLLYGPAGVTPAPAEPARNNICDKLPPVLSHVSPRQATFFGVQSVPVTDGSGRFATICAPPRAGVPVPVSTQPMYPLARIAPLIVGHQGLPHGELTAPIERGDKVAEWKDKRRTKERADIVVQGGGLSQAEKIEMEKCMFQFCGFAFRGKAETDHGPGAACMRLLGAVV